MKLRTGETIDSMADYLFWLAGEGLLDDDTGESNYYGRWTGRIGRWILTENSIGQRDAYRLDSTEDVMQAFAQELDRYTAWLEECPIVASRTIEL